MNESSNRLRIPRGIVGLLTAFCVVGGALLVIGRRDYPALHTILDTCVFLLSGVLALLLWGMGVRMGRSFFEGLAISFGITSLLEFIHVMVTVEWFGSLAAISASAPALRPATWPPAAYLLPIGIGCTVWLMHRKVQRTIGLALLLIVFSAGLLLLFLRMPHYTAPGFLGISRPALVAVPALWIIVGISCWRMRFADRILSPLALMALLLSAAGISMLYSLGPHDTPAMVAHLGKGIAYLTFLLLLMRMASFDMLERIRAERELAELNEKLERRVHERTAQLESITKSSAAEVSVRQRAEQALQESRQLLQAVIDNSTAIIHVKGLDGRYLLVNQRFADVLHLGKEAVVGKTDHEIFPKGTADAFDAMDRRAIAAKDTVTEEEVIPHDDGPHTYVSVKCPLRSNDGEPYAVFGILTDITERKQVEQALRANEEQMRQVVDTALDAVISIDDAGVITSWNPQAEAIFGWTRQEAVGRSLADTIVPEQYRRAHRHGLHRYLTTGEAAVLNKRIEITAVRRDGEEIPIELSITSIRVGEKVSFTAFVRDITERRRAEQALRESEQRLRMVIDLVPHYIFAKDSEGRFLFVNRAFAESYKLTPEQLSGRIDRDLVPNPIQYEAFRRDDLEVIESGTEKFVPAEPRTNLEGRTRIMQTTKIPFTVPGLDKPAVLGVAVDITALKEAEDALRESEERFRTMADSAPVLIWVSDTTKACTWFNRRWLDFVGRTLEQEIGDGWAESVHPEDLQQCIERYHRAYETREAFTMEYRIRRFDGEWRWMIDQGVPRFHSDHEFAGFIGSCTDITELRRKEQKLQNQLARLDLLHRITRAIAERQDLRSIFQVVIRSLEDNLTLDLCCACLYDPNDHALTVSGVGVRSASLAHELAMTDHARIHIDENGLSRCVAGVLVYEPDIEGLNFPFPARLAQGGLRSLVAAPLLVESQVFGVVIAARRQAGSFSSGECEFIKQLSEHVALAANHAQLHSALQQAYDDLRQTQQAVMQQERLRALGQMASGIAHDINNAISPVALYTESLLETEANLSERGRGYLETIQHAIDDVAETVARMREFYRQREPELTLRQFLVNPLVQQVIKLTEARWSDMPQQRGKVIQLRTDLATDLPPILGVESEVREALTNLIFNAVDAMPDGGTLTFRTRMPKPSSRSGERPVSNGVYVEISDTGIGMDEDTQRRCLEPFYTTKGERGTGLGLAMVYGTVRRHGAELEIDSAVGHGTTMRIIFPVAASLTATSSDPLPAPKPPRRLRLLIVDDDPLLLKSLRDTLETDGHLVITADGGQAGIDAFVEAHRNEEPFAVVITDLGMPYVDGRKVASSIKAASNSTPIILLTGWGQRLAAEGDMPQHVDCVLTKPPKLRELREALATVVASPPET